MRLIVSLLLLFTAGYLYAQDAGIPRISRELLGRPSSVTLDRVYVRMRGRNVGATTYRLSVEKFGKEGSLIEYVEYGTGSVRTQYKYNGNIPSAEVTYLDATGNASPDAEAKFKPRVDTVIETDLCPRYTVRLDQDRVAKINRTYETCSDGSSRAVIIEGLDQGNNIVQSVRTDAKSRKWHRVYEYDVDGNITEYRYTVTVGAKSYTHTITYSDYQFDEQGNWIRVTATSFISSRPDELMYQFNEHRTITYYSDSTPTNK